MLTDAPPELQVAIQEFWAADEWENAAAISFLESNWNAFAVADTRTPEHPCGSVIYKSGGVAVSAEYSIGYFQINACNIPPDWNPNHLYNARHNAGTAHDIWSRQGWSAWYYSAKRLGLI